MSTKVFVGNLAFRTTDQALQEAFSKHGEVKSGVIITRGRRSLGYGFVEFATAEQAAASVDKMNKAEISGRQIKVELAKDPSERPAQPEGEVGPAKRRRRARDEDEGDNAGNAPANSTTTTSTASQSNESGNEKKRVRKPKKRNNDNNTNTSNNASNKGSDSPSAPKQPRPPREPREPRPPREPRAPREKVPSKTTLFVANLPFSVDDAQLLKAFADTKAKAAHVVCTRTGRSRGYGFVEFDSETDQLDALKIANGKEIAGEKSNRAISVTISNSPPPAPATAPATSSGAPTPASPPATTGAPATN